MLAAAATTAQAGGILTNTNQSIDFLRNPARDAAIGVDGIYSNPAGVSFMDDGLHVAFNWQIASQTRTIESQNELFKLGAKNGSSDTKSYEGTALAPVIPSIQLAYNKDKWSYQFGFSVTGGGGKCEFDQGIGSFETAVGAIAQKMIATSAQLNQQLAPLNASVPAATGYDMDAYMKGKQFYFGIQVGAARQLTENLSVYGGLRLLYGTASYEARLNNLRVMNGSNGMALAEYFEGLQSGLTTAGANLAATAQLVKDGIQQYVQGYMSQGMTQEQAMQQAPVQQLVAQGQQLEAAKQQLTAAGQQLAASGETLAPYANGMNLMSDQEGWGIAPIIGVDYKTGNFNFAAKYEFKTRIRMKNKSTLKEASVIEATNKFVDGTSVPEDQPALLAVGAQWSFLPTARVNVGYHHFFDKNAHWYNHTEELLDGDTNEYLAGVEWDATPRLTVSGGAQITDYGMSDSFMNDMSFVVDSWTFGLGLKYRLTDHVQLSAAYFQTNYQHYKMATPKQEMAGLGLTVPAGHNDFTRTNYVAGIGCELTF